MIFIVPDDTARSFAQRSLAIKALHLSSRNKNRRLAALHFIQVR
jgi:hypothetical protein